MNMHDNLRRLHKIAEGLEELRNDFVFVGGSVASLYSDDHAASDIRPTLDVDIVIEVANYGDYEILESKLRQKRFENDLESGVICRWKYFGDSVDIMPNEERILGFSNFWYQTGYRQKIKYQLTPEIEINIFPVLYFIAAKIEALISRGGNDWRYSSDFEDIIYILNNNKGIMSEFKREKDEKLKDYLREWSNSVLMRKNYREEIECVLPYGEYTRIDYILNILKSLSSS